ncbi:MAG: 1-acyl-sn-glycerol-3-phosphate acyltransferase [Polyangiaceae bacterium]
MRRPPGVPDPAWIARYRALQPLWWRLWPGRLLGAENIPAHGRFVLIANHSGLGVAECATFPGVWLDHFGDRPLAGMAHSALFLLPGMASALRGLGAIPASKDEAARAIAVGHPLLLFPGGDLEAMRPTWRSREVTFGGRTGFVRLARAHGLEIVPLAIVGSHVTIPNLAGNRALAWLTGARLIGMHRAPLPVLSVAAAALSLLRSTGKPIPRRALSALVAFWATALVPWIPSAIDFHALPPVRDLGRSDEAVAAEVLERLRSVVSSRRGTRH